jgi:hypothetical protein
MHIHPNQINPNLQLDNLYAAEKAAAKREVERTRKKLLEFASKLEGEAESGGDYIVKLGERKEEQNEQDQRNSKGRKKLKEQIGPEPTDNSVSDWA